MKNHNVLKENIQIFLACFLVEKMMKVDDMDNNYVILNVKFIFAAHCNKYFYMIFRIFNEK